MKIERSKEWWLEMVKREGTSAVGAGAVSPQIYDDAYGVYVNVMEGSRDRDKAVRAVVDLVLASKGPAMTTSDLDPDALAKLIVGMVRRGTQTKADGICRAAGPMVSFEEWATDLISSALHAAEQRGQEAMREKAARAAIQRRGSKCQFDGCDCAGPDMCRARRAGTPDEIANAIRHLTVREPGVTGKGEGE